MNPPITTSFPEGLELGDHDTDVEYMMRLAAEVIRQAAPTTAIIDKIALHCSHEPEDEQCTGSEFAARLETYADRQREIRLKRRSFPSISGTVIQIGGSPATITFTTDREQLTNIPPMLYQKFTITFEPW